MKKLLMSLMLGLASHSASAALLEVHTVPGEMTAYTDPAQIKRAGNIATVNFVYNMLGEHSTSTGLKFFSTTVQVEFDCATSQKRNLSITFFAGKMAEGKPLSTLTPPPNWEPVPADSPFAPELKLACKK